ncbi:MAG: ATP-binding protein [Gemmatimonadota bacterium]|nr:ATP-binding protein [Gemmatimonadota bacterium]
MTSSAHDRSALGAYDGEAGGWLGSLVEAVAAAPDFRAAVSEFLERVCHRTASQRGYVMLLDSAARQLLPIATRGFDEAAQPTGRTLDDLSDPFIIAMLGTDAVACREGPPRSGVPRGSAVLVVPIVQPRQAELPRFLHREEAGRLLGDSCTLHPAQADAAADAISRAATSPFGILVMGADSSARDVADIARVTRLVGPVLANAAAQELHVRRAQELAEQRTVLTSIVNSLPDPIVIIDRERRILVQNRRAEHLLSVLENDSEGRRRAVEINNLLLTSHLSKDAAVTAGSGARSGTGAGARELNMVDPDDGTDLLFEVLTQPLDEDESAMVSVLRDVTDLRRAAGELELQVQRVRLAEYEAKRESDRLNLILTNVADPILVTDDRANILLMNRQAELLFGSATSNIGYAAGDRSSAVRSNDTRFTTFISDFSLSPEVARREDMDLVRPGDSPVTIPMEVVAGKIIDRRGEPLAIVSVLHDLTEQTENERLYKELKNFSSELEARVSAATADLGEQNERLQWQSRELEKANRLKSEFLASMSHELRTPINALIGYTALMLDRIYGDLNERQEEGLTRIRAAAQHLLALINDILDLAKIEAGRMPLHLEEANLQEVMREASVQVDPLIRKKGLAYQWLAPGEPVRMVTDRTKVKQIILNLLSNAVKFTHSGKITLTAVMEGSTVRIDVADTGIGIRKEDLTAIWDDFRQVDQSRTREFGGTGLGLSITRKLTSVLGGRVTLESTFGTGSTFSVILPVQSEPHSEPHSEPQASHTASARDDHEPQKALTGRPPHVD